MADTHLSARAKPKGKCVVINHKSHRAVSIIYYNYILPDWSDYRCNTPWLQCCKY